MQISKESLLARSETILDCELGDQMVLMDIDTGEYYEFDPIASTIWKKLNKPMTPAKICQYLLQDYSVDADLCQRDVLTFVGELVDLGVLSLHSK